MCVLNESEPLRHEEQRQAYKGVEAIENVIKLKIFVHNLKYVTGSRWPDGEKRGMKEGWLLNVWVTRLTVACLHL